MRIFIGDHPKNRNTPDGISADGTNCQLARVNSLGYANRARSRIAAFRHSPGASENGRAEQSGTDLEIAAESARFGEPSTQRLTGRLSYSGRFHRCELESNGTCRSRCIRHHKRIGLIAIGEADRSGLVGRNHCDCLVGAKGRSLNSSVGALTLPACRQAQWRTLSGGWGFEPC